MLSFIIDHTGVRHSLLYYVLLIIGTYAYKQRYIHTRVENESASLNWMTH